MSQLALAGDGFTDAQVREALQARRGTRELRFKYELLTAANVHKAWMLGVEQASVANNALAEIKRTAQFNIREGFDSVDYLSDRIRPWARVRVLTGWREFPLGVFLLPSPQQATEGQGAVRDIEAYDQGLVLQDDKVTTRYTVNAGTNYITAVGALLTSAGVTDLSKLTATSSTLPVARDWEPGTTKLSIINDLLGAINYVSLYFDATGRAVAEPYIAPSTRAPEYDYDGDDPDVSLVAPKMVRTLDLYSVPNQWTLVTSEADRAVLTSVYTNTNPASPTSTASRLRTIPDWRTEEAADQAALDAKVARLAFEASQVYEAVEMETPIMPQHGNADVLTVSRGDLAVDGKYSEHEWGFDCRAGAMMKHRVRRVVSV